MKAKQARVAYLSHSERFPSGPLEGWLWLKHGKVAHYFGSEINPVSKCGKFKVSGKPAVGNYGGDRCAKCISLNGGAK